MKKRIIL